MHISAIKCMHTPSHDTNVSQCPFCLWFISRLTCLNIPNRSWLMSSCDEHNYQCQSSEAHWTDWHFKALSPCWDEPSPLWMGHYNTGGTWKVGGVTLYITAEGIDEPVNLWSILMRILVGCVSSHKPAIPAGKSTLFTGLNW